MHLALTQAKREQLVFHNIAEFVNKPKQSKHEISPLTVEQIKAFLDFTSEHRFYVPFLVECHTGLRRGEILGLRWQDINFGKQTLSVKQSLIRTRKGLLMSDPKTSKSRRAIPLADEVIYILKAHKARQNQDKLIAGGGRL